jgi:hypothetical protein
MTLDESVTDQAGYAAIVRAAASVATCAHADATVAKLANKFLTIEIKRWGELDETDD